MLEIFVGWADNNTIMNRWQVIKLSYLMVTLENKVNSRAKRYGFVSSCYTSKTFEMSFHLYRKAYNNVPLYIDLPLPVSIIA